MAAGSNRNSSGYAALVRCQCAYDANEFTEAALHAATALGDPDPMIAATARYYLGNLAEIDRRDGRALEHWALGLQILETSGAGTSPLAEQIHQAATALCKRPRGFVSYDSHESSHATLLVEALDAAGIETIEYQRDFRPGAAIDAEIAAGALQSTATIVLWSERYATRPYCVAELETARRLVTLTSGAGRGYLLMMVALGAASMPDDLRGLIWLEAPDGVTPDIADAVAAAVVGRRRARPGR